MVRLVPGIPLILTVLTVCPFASAAAQIVISGNENKIDLAPGTATPILNADGDSLTILDFSTGDIPTQTHLMNVPNSVIGPPSNIAITHDAKLALVANSLKLDSQSDTGWSPAQQVHIVDLSRKKPQIVGQVQTGLQPSGISITSDDRYAIVANRAAGTVTLLSIEGTQVRARMEESVCAHDELPSDVAIAPDDRFALVSVNEGGFLRVVEIENGKLRATRRKINVHGKPYRTVISHDGRLAITAGSGSTLPDVDALTIVDLTVPGFAAREFIAIPTGPESFDVSPDGQLVAVVSMNGSNLAPDDPQLTEHGLLTILRRRGDTFEKVQQIPIGPIPEGVAFTGNGRRLLVQCHPSREIWILDVLGGEVVDNGTRIAMPGMPSSLRAAVPWPPMKP